MSSKISPKSIVVLLACLSCTIAYANDDSQVSAMATTDADTVQNLHTDSSLLKVIDTVEAQDKHTYESWSNAQLKNELNQIHTLSPQERRELLLEVSRRIEQYGHFEVEKHEQRFGRVVQQDESESKQESSDGPRLEEIVIARIEASDDESEAVRVKEVRKTHQPVPRVSTGRGYSSQ